MRSFNVLGNYANQTGSFNQSGPYGQLMGGQMQANVMGCASTNAYPGERYGLAAIDWSRLYGHANGMQNAYRPYPIETEKRMRVCQSCGFSREAYADSTNLSPETCGNCS